MILDISIVIIYSVALLLIFLYALAQLNLFVNYLKAKKANKTAPVFDFSNSEEIPFVTI